MRFFKTYSRFILKNVLGWILILGSFVIGPFIPGPGGIPLFLIGFALVTFPGKRRLTARVLRGRLLSPATRGYRRASWAISLLVPAALILLMGHQSYVEGWMYRRKWDPVHARPIGFAAMALVLLGILRLAPLVVNWMLGLMPRIRRRMRPGLRRLGVRLLPPRWGAHPHGAFKDRIRHAEEEIIHVSETFRRRASAFWHASKPWLIKLIGAAIVGIIFYRLLRPIILQWDNIRPHMAEVRWSLLLLAALMFAVNQLACRIVSWRAVLQGLGWWMPPRPAARIWAASELVRYVPGVIWQMVGRALMAKPYGLPMTTCSISQILEITIYLLANVIVAAGTLSLVSGQIADDQTRLALRLAVLLVPLLLAFLYPKVFYPVVNFILRRIGKPVIEERLSGLRLLALLALAVAGQMWLGLAIWVGTHSVLQVPLTDVWLLAGAYCLAWSAGFCMASIAPSGIGIRELVLSGTLILLVSGRTGLELEPATRNALFAAIALLLRLWATVGELLFAAAAHLADLSGLRGKVTQKAMPAQEVMASASP